MRELLSEPGQELLPEEVFRNLLTSAPAVISVSDPDGIMLYINRTTPERELADVVGSSIYDYLPPSDREGYRQAQAEVFATGETRQIELHTTSGRWWQTTLVPLRRGDRVVAIMGIGADATERKRLEAGLRHAQKMEAIGQLTAGIAHNFNNILMGILPNIQLSMADASEPQRRRLRDAEAAAWRAAELIRQLMVFARRRPEATHRPLDVREVVRGITDLCTEAFGRVGIALDNDGDPPAVAGDAALLGQVFLNMLVNARDACERGGDDGRIRVHISGLAAGDAELADHPQLHQRACARIAITDNGVGMNDDVRERVFEPFFTTKEPGRGTGLGLATAYAIVDEHHGVIRCDSTPGGGSTFTVYLPASTGELTEAEPPPAGHLPGGTEVVLVIDEDELVRQSVADALGWKGYTVLIGRDLHDGSAILRRLAGETDLVVADASTPSRWRSTALATLLEDAGQAKVVLLHSQAEPPPEHERAAAVLRKPVGVEELLRTVRRVLDA
ncbi:MAG TPA: ATP-binding protein [Kofleriaceae bacterium]|nr:ATP-binding protein [Kofleriaceae bacterium]